MNQTRNKKVLAVEKTVLDLLVFEPAPSRDLQFGASGWRAR